MSEHVHWDDGSEPRAIFADMAAAADLIFRDYGHGRRHSTGCIYLTNDRGQTEWCCAADCMMQRRDAA